MSPSHADRSSRRLRRPGPRRPEGLPSGPDEVRRAVLDAAARLFAERGVPQVTLRDIAREAEVNLGLISRYVGSRDDLVRSVFADLTEQLVAEMRAAPTSPRGFDPDSTMGRWTRVLTFLVLTDPGEAIRIGSGPLDELRSIMERLYGSSPEAARLRAAQLMGSAIGWRLFEPYLVAAAGLGDLPIDEVRDELTRTHRRLGATPWPSPPDPPESD